MQIKCSKDIGGWFDELAIINVKINLCHGPKKDLNILNFKQLSNEIKEQIGELLYNKIFGSEDYQELYEANLLVFKKVEEAQKTVGLAKEIDSLNYERYLKKSALQKKYFGGEIKEIKIGY